MTVQGARPYGSPLPAQNIGDEIGTRGATYEEKCRAANVLFTYVKDPAERVEVLKMLFMRSRPQGSGGKRLDPA